jgi:hypothetical protein
VVDLIAPARPGAGFQAVEAHSKLKTCSSYP